MQRGELGLPSRYTIQKTEVRPISILLNAYLPEHYKIETPREFRGQRK